MTLMEKIRLVAAIAEILVILFKVQGNAGQTFESSCSSYTVHKPSSRQQPTNWNESLHLCSLNNSQLVSIEDENERNFLEEKLEPKRYPRFEYFIGLRKSSGKWTWISNDSIEVAPLKDPWASRSTPDDIDTHCAKMYFNFDKHFVYDDIHCNKYKLRRVGYICEKHVGCQNEKAKKATTERQQSTRFSTLKPLASTPTIQLTLSTRHQTTKLLTAEEVTSSIQPSTRLFTTEIISVSRGLQPMVFTQQQSGEEAKQSKATLAPIHTERRPGGYLTSEKLMIAVFVEGALLIVALVIIGMLLFKLRVKHNSDQNGRSITAKSSNQLEEPRENASLLNPENAARQLGLSVEAGDSGNVATRQLTAPPCITEGGYAVLCPRTITSEGDFYAHLLPSKPENRTSADCSETPTYANETAVVHEYMNV